MGISGRKRGEGRERGEGRLFYLLGVLIAPRAMPVYLCVRRKILSLFMLSRATQCVTHKWRFHLHRLIREEDGQWLKRARILKIAAAEFFIRPNCAAVQMENLIVCIVYRVTTGRACGVAGARNILYIASILFAKYFIRCVRFINLQPITIKFG